MKEKIKEFLKDGRNVILILFVLQLILNIFITPDRYDDEFFINSVKEISIIDFVSMRYQEWTSRVIIEIVLCTVLSLNKYIWIFINTLMMTIIGYSISELFIKDNKKEMNWIILCLVLIYPLDRMSSAGWGATTINYIWPLALSLFSMIPIRKIIDGKKIKWYMYPIYSIALLYAGNQEQTCMITFAVYALFTIILIVRDKKKINPFMIIQTLLLIASLIFILTCPGNLVRKSDEIISSYPDFRTLTMLDKISLGVVSTIAEMLVNSSITFLVLSIIVVVYIFTCYKNTMYRVVSLIPLMSILALGLFKDIATKIFPYIDVYKDIIIQQKSIVNASNYNQLINFFPIIMSLIILLSFMLCILLIFKKPKNNVAILVFVIGILSRVILAFSPTVFTSTNRTYVFFEFSLLIIVALILQEFAKRTDKNDKRIQNRLYGVIKIGAMFQYINTLICVIVTQM